MPSPPRKKPVKVLRANHGKRIHSQVADRLCVLGALLVGFMGQRWLLPEEHGWCLPPVSAEGCTTSCAASGLGTQAAHPRLSIEVIETDGSLDNAKRLQNRKPIWRFCKTTRRAGSSSQSHCHSSGITPLPLPPRCGHQSLHELAGHTSQSAPKAVDPSSLLMNYSVTSAGGEGIELKIYPWPRPRGNWSPGK